MLGDNNFSAVEIMQVEEQGLRITEGLFILIS